MNMKKRYFLLAFLLAAFFQVNAQTDKQMNTFIDKLMSQMTPGRENRTVKPSCLKQFYCRREEGWRIEPYGAANCKR